MIRLTFLMRRATDLTRDGFQSYWRETHGPLVARHSHTLKLLRYVQTQTLPDERRREGGPRGTMDEPYDGAEEFWWFRRQDLVSAIESPAGEAAMHELMHDETCFVDLPNSPLWFAHEYPQVNPAPETIVASEFSSLVKFYYPIRSLPHLTTEEAQRHWSCCHGPLIRRTAAAGHVLRYIQVHRYEDDLESRLREARGTSADPYIGHAEIWFDRARSFGREETPERVRARELAIEDERRFVDFGRSSMWFAKERVFVDNR